MGPKTKLQENKIWCQKSEREHRWYINGDLLEIVDSFCYLGMKFHYNGNLEPGIKALSDQSLEATDQLFERMSFDVKTKLRLFDSVVAPILLYASEVWGIYGYDNVDKVHIQGVKKGRRHHSKEHLVFNKAFRYHNILLF